MWLSIKKSKPENITKQIQETKMDVVQANSFPNKLNDYTLADGDLLSSKL